MQCFHLQGQVVREEFLPSFGLRGPEDEGIMIHRNVGNCLPFDMTQRLRRHNFKFNVARLFYSRSPKLAFFGRFPMHKCMGQSHCN